VGVLYYYFLFGLMAGSDFTNQSIRY